MDADAPATNIPATNTSVCDTPICEGGVTRQVTLQNVRGLHARAASKFATLAQSFDAKIEVTSINDVCRETVVGDSIMELLLLGSACGEDIRICATGADAQTAIEALSKLVNDRFGESE